MWDGSTRWVPEFDFTVHGHVVLLSQYVQFSIKYTNNNIKYMWTSKFSALLPPTLTVDKLVITETDSVTLNCQTPPSVSVSVCFFRILSGEPAKTFSCLKTLTGTELLKISHQSSPAEVKVKCFYLQISQSPDSNTFSIIIRSEWTLLLWTDIRIYFYSISPNNSLLSTKGLCLQKKCWDILNGHSFLKFLCN